MFAGVMDSGTFGGWLARRLVSGGYRSQRAFARAIEMDPTYLSRIINGHVARPERETLERMAKKLGVTYEEIAREAGALPDLPAGVMPPPPQLPLPADADPPYDPAMLVAYVEAHPDPQFQQELASLKRDYPDGYARMCVSIYRAWTNSGHLAAAVVRETSG